MNFRCTMLLLWGIFSEAVMACELSELNFLAADDAQHYTFTQTRTVTALRNPLTSSGTLGLTTNAELVWQTLQPLKSTLVISTAGVRQFDSADALVTSTTNPVADGMARMFLAILSGDPNAIEATFSHTLACEDGAWQLTLTPVDPAVAQFLDVVTVSGSERIEFVSFREVRGDFTEVLLSAAVSSSLDNLESYLGP